MVRASTVVLTAAALVAATAIPAQAQTAPSQPVPTRITPAPVQTPARNETVTSRARPELDPVGLRVGSLVAFPSLELAPEFNDNIFKTDTGKQADLIVQTTPALLVQSDWNRHFARAYFDVTSGNYVDNSDEDFLDATGSVDGRFDIMRDSYVSAGFVFNKLHEDRGSPDGAAGREPTEFYVYKPTLGVYNKWNRVSLGVDGEMIRYNFVDAATTTSEINQDDRDRYRYQASGRLGYEIVPQYEAFVRGTYNVINYDDSLDDVGFQRDSDGYEFVGGARIDITGVTFGDLYVGYRRQKYDDARLSTISGPTYGGSLTWNVTGLTTVKGFISRTVEETTISLASGSFDSEYGVSVDHELLRSLILSGRASFLNSDYEGITREDDYLKFGVSGKYLMNRNLYVTLRYDYERRDSDAAGQDYTQNAVLLSLSGQL
jgi:hypothetical protein